MNTLSDRRSIWQLGIVLASLWVFLGNAGIVHADWVQLPELDLRRGVDVDATDIAPPGLGPRRDLPKTLADDFLCTSTDPITGILIWGSWRFDQLPEGDPGNVAFRLSIHSDVPAGQPHHFNPEQPRLRWSRPGELLWQHESAPGSFTVSQYGTGLASSWYDPATGLFIPFVDRNCWQYSFQIPSELAFVQQGSPDNPVTYWLDVEAVVPRNRRGLQWEFGWKTSDTHWNDDAVWRTDKMSPWQWNELRNHRARFSCAGEGIDLAFAISKAPEPGTNTIPEPGTLVLLGIGAVGLLANAWRRRRQ